MFNENVVFENNRNELFSSQLQKIIKTKPNGLIRYATILLCANLLFILVIAYVIKYPIILNTFGKIISRPEELFPNKATEIVMLIRTSEVNTIVINQQILLKFDAYPYAEFGLLKGAITALNYNQKGNEVLIKINLKKGYVTSQEKILQLKTGLEAQCDIVIRETNILENIFNHHSL